MEIDNNKTQFVLIQHRGKIALALAAMLMGTAPSQAQMPEQLLRGILGAVSQQNSRQPAPAGHPVPQFVNTTQPEVVVPSRAAPVPRVAYPTKSALLAATLRGDFAMLARASGEDRQKLVDSVLRILHREYSVPALPENCDYWFAADVFNLFSLATEANVGTLSDKAPEFYNYASSSQAKVQQEISDRLQKLQSPRDPTACDSRAMGKIAPHPYKIALPSLLTEYAQATQEYVESERAARKQSYQSNLAKQQEQERERQAVVQARQVEAKVAEQKRIEAEATRIRQEQQRRDQQDRTRVGG